MNLHLHYMYLQYGMAHETVCITLAYCVVSVDLCRCRINCSDGDCRRQTQFIRTPTVAWYRHSGPN